MTVQTKPPVEGGDNIPVASDRYDEEETVESVLGKMDKEQIFQGAKVNWMHG